MKEIILPELGEGIDKAIVAIWHCREGDAIHADDDVVQLVTDKASFQVPAGSSGILKKICVEEGKEAKVGEALARIEVQ